MKKIYIAFLFLFVTAASFSQSYTYGNEWINHSQKYYKIKLYKEGIYRIDSTTLANSGVQLLGLDPRNFQIFIKGQEQYIHVHGEGDGAFNTSDFIEFYGTFNDGSFDSSMYTGISTVPNPYYSIVQDTAIAFLTWNSSVTNKRYLYNPADTLFSSFAPSSYFFNNAVLAQNATYWLGAYNSLGALDSRYVPTEGRADANGIVNGGAPEVFTIPTPNAYAGGPTATLVTNIMGESCDYALFANPTLDHNVKIEWKDGTGTNNLLADTIFYGYQNIRNSDTINPSQLGPTTDITFTSLADASYVNGNNTAISFVKLWYPQTYNFNAANFYNLYVPDEGSQTETYADFSNFTYPAGDSVKAFDMTNGRLIYPTMNGSSGKFLLPNAGNIKRVYITSDTNDIIVTSLSKVNGNGTFIDYMSQSADSVFIIVTHSKFWNEALLYKNHKQSVAGGSYNVVLANVDDLYDQFAYGLAKHQKSIRNFSKFLLDTFPSTAPPKYLFLIGKSTYGLCGLSSYCYNCNFLPASDFYNKNYVPSFGYPPSDNLITAGLNGTYLQPAIPTGRISATTPQEVSWYLDKVIQHDAMTVEAWQKNVMHFIGGGTINEQTLFGGYMNYYKTIISGTSFGGNVSSFYKNTSAPIQTLIADSIIDLVNSGVSLMTFYGHGSSGAFDINLNDPTVYNNTGKYPVLLANSCYAGDIHTIDTTSLSEKYLFTQDKGSIAFIASVSLGVAQVLSTYSGNFYTNISTTNYGKGVGDIMKGAITSTQGGGMTQDSIEKLTCMEMTLHGDPSVRINPFTKPDYAITNSDLTFNTTLNVDSIQVNLRITNLARAVNGAFKVKIVRTFPDLSTKTDTFTMNAPYYVDTLSFFIPVDFVKGIGLNYFSANIDYTNIISEIDDNINNKTNGNVPLLINGRDIVPVYPYEYEVVPLTSTIKLKASTADPFVAAKNYVFQIDTTDLFNSPALATTIINAPGGVVEWQVNLMPQDCTVYFWRVSRDSIDPTGYNWRESSFQTIDTMYGWGQAHFFQYKKDHFRFVNYDRPVRHFDFPDSKNDIDVHDGFYNCCGFGGNIADVNVDFNYNSILEHAASNALYGWTFVVIDSISGELQPNFLHSDSITYQYGTCNLNWPQTAYFYDFGNTNLDCAANPLWKDSMLAFLQNIDLNLKGKYLLGYSNNWWRGGSSEPDTAYSPALYAELEKWGLPTSIETIPDTMPIVFLGRINIGAGNAHYQIGLDKKAITFKDSIITHWNRGYITSPIIGPSQKWHSVHWRYGSLESPSYDTVNVYVLGLNSVTGTVDTLFKLGENIQDLLNLEPQINAQTYPFLKLMAIIADDTLHTAPQMRRWHVIYDPAPEGALNPSSGYACVNDTLQEGDSLRITFPFKNVSEFAFPDSLVFTYWVEDNGHVIHPLNDILLRNNLQPDSTIKDIFRMSTNGYVGQNALWIHVNPPGNQKYQYEQYDFNNIARIPFGVIGDKINPVLDVTFDGVHILNQDIVSSKPKISITLKDENKFLGTDTTDFEVYLKYPGSTVDQRQWFCPNCSPGTPPASYTIPFTPPNLPANSCKLDFDPILPQDGMYQLHVKAKDRSNNYSGATDYKIQFEVINKPSITQVLNYPNPFSTSTKFVFTITGSEVPQTFMIQIMTITGKVVREIKREELGYIHIGRNITEYAWDGKDDFGDLLANGTYLYRVTTRLNHEVVENRESGADKFFTKEIGKMVLIR